MTIPGLMIDENYGRHSTYLDEYEVPKSNNYLVGKLIKSVKFISAIAQALAVISKKTIQKIHLPRCDALCRNLRV